MAEVNNEDDVQTPDDGGAASAMAEALAGANEQNLSLEAVYDIPVKISVVLGKTSMQVNQLLKLGRGAVIELDRKVGEPIDIFVNNRLVARGEIVVVEDRIGVTMTEIIKSDRK
jgi:flagellar motor switch protein FliN/FliY